MQVATDREIVKTVSGRRVPRENTKFIKDEYHEKEYDCFKVEGKWYRLGSGLIAYNLDTKSFFLLKALDSLNFRTKVVVALDSSDNPIFGYTRARRDFFYPVYSRREVFYALNSDIAAKLGTFNVGTGSFQKADLGGSNGGFNVLNPKNFPYSLKDYKLGSTSVEKYLKSDQLDYNAFHALLAKAYHDKNQEEFDTKLSKQYNSVMGPLSFGIEAESNNLGITDLQIISRNALVCLRDGSVGGFELVTLPHKGYEGLLSTVAQFSVAQKLFTYDSSCSVHIHVAGHDLTEKQILALYCLCYRLQDEIFEFIHPYKRNIEYLKSLQHEYSEPLKSLGIVYNKGIVRQDGSINETIFKSCFATFCKFITLGNSGELKDCFGNEPKYRINSRYSWVNFVNFLKSTSSTVEFRCFPPTFDPYAIATWSMLCQAIYKYAVDNWLAILTDNFHVKLDNIWDHLLATVDRDESAEFVNFVESLRKVVSSITSLNSSHAIVRQVSYGHYNKMLSEYHKVYSNLSTPLRKDLGLFKWKDPDIVKEINDIQIRK